MKIFLLWATMFFLASCMGACWLWVYADAVKGAGSQAQKNAIALRQLNKEWAILIGGMYKIDIDYESFINGSYEGYQRQPYETDARMMQDIFKYHHEIYPSPFGQGKTIQYAKNKLPTPSTYCDDEYPS